MSDNDLNNIDIDLTGVEISRPLLPRQTLKVRTGDVRVERRDGTGPKRLVIPLILEQPGTDSKGEEVGPGFTIIDSMLLEPTGKLTLEDIKRMLGQFQAAVKKLDKPDPGAFGNAADYSGREVMATFDIRTDSKDASKQYQSVKRYTAVE